MKLQNSYIFLKNTYRKEPSGEERGTSAAVIGNNIRISVFNYIKSVFPDLSRDDGPDRPSYRKKFFTKIEVEKFTCTAEFIFTTDGDAKYLDVVVEGKTKTQVIICLEYIHDKILTSGIRENYIDIISYDAVSEYYCNEIYPKLNMLERNLRKLLFNIYVVNFGSDYYKATIDDTLQNKVKGLIGVDCNGGENDQIKKDFHTNTRKDTEEVKRLQRFFYSLDFADIQKMLFTSSWTSFGESEKASFLKKYTNLSELTDSELRDAFSKFTPKSDWERFFSNKIEIPEVEKLMDQIRQYRNRVAHCKFLYREDYHECKKMVSRLNREVLRAIELTEEKDFAEKNAEALRKALNGINARLATYLMYFADKFVEVPDTSLYEGLLEGKQAITHQYQMDYQIKEGVIIEIERNGYGKS